MQIQSLLSYTLYLVKIIQPQLGKEGERREGKGGEEEEKEGGSGGEGSRGRGEVGKKFIIIVKIFNFPLR